MGPRGEPRAARKQRRRAPASRRAAADAAVRRRRAPGRGQRRSRVAAHAPAPRSGGRRAVPPGRAVHRGFRRADRRSAPDRGRPRRRAGGRARRDPGRYPGVSSRLRARGSTAAVRGCRRASGASGTVAGVGESLPRRGANVRRGVRETPPRAGSGLRLARRRRARPGRRVRVRGVAPPRERRHLAVLGSGGGGARKPRRVGHGVGARAEGLFPDGGVRRGRQARPLRVSSPPGDLPRARRSDRTTAAPRGGRAGPRDVRGRRSDLGPGRAERGRRVRVDARRRRRRDERRGDVRVVSRVGSRRPARRRRFAAAIQDRRRVDVGVRGAGNVRGAAARRRVRYGRRL